MRHLCPIGYTIIIGSQKELEWMTDDTDFSE